MKIRRIFKPLNPKRIIVTNEYGIVRKVLNDDIILEVVDEEIKGKDIVEVLKDIDKELLENVVVVSNYDYEGMIFKKETIEKLKQLKDIEIKKVSYNSLEAFEVKTNHKVKELKSQYISDFDLVEDINLTDPKTDKEVYEILKIIPLKKLKEVPKEILKGDLLNLRIR